MTVFTEQTVFKSLISQTLRCSKKNKQAAEIPFQNFCRLFILHSVVNTHASLVHG